jgi:hypothetical protein
VHKKTVAAQAVTVFFMGDAALLLDAGLEFVIALFDFCAQALDAINNVIGSFFAQAFQFAHEMAGFGFNVAPFIARFQFGQTQLQG